MMNDWMAALAEKLGTRLTAIMPLQRHYPGGRIDAAVIPLIVLEDETDFEAVWHVLQPRWSTLPKKPWVITADLLELWRQLHPDWQVGEQTYAGVAADLLEATGALFGEESEHLTALCEAYEIAADLPASAQLAALEARLAGVFAADVSALKQWNAPRILPDLVAIYDQMPTALLVVAPSQPDWLLETDWTAVNTWFEGRYEQLRVATPAHLVAVAQGDWAFEFGVGQYRHVWGDDLLAERPISIVQMVRCALRHVLDVYTQLIAAEYFAAAETDLRKAAHDLLNHLLRIHLRYDVLAFHLGDDAIEPPPTLVEQSYGSMHERIRLICYHFRRWITHYQTILDRVDG